MGGRVRHVRIPEVTIDKKKEEKKEVPRIGPASRGKGRSGNKVSKVEGKRRPEDGEEGSTKKRSGVPQEPSLAVLTDARPRAKRPKTWLAEKHSLNCGQRRSRRQPQTKTPRKLLKKKKVKIP